MFSVSVALKWFTFSCNGYASFLGKRKKKQKVMKTTHGI